MELRNVFLILIGISIQFPGKQAAPTTHLRHSTTEFLNYAEELSDDFVKNYLLKFGYMSEVTNGNKDVNDGKTDSRITEGIKRFQEFARLPKTGKLDEATEKLMKSPRCQVLDVPDVTAKWHSRRKRFLASGRRWNRANLTFRVLNYPSSPELQDRAIVDQLVETAINDWREVTPLTLSKSTSNTSDIKIRFVSLDHGDGFPFDGRGLFVGHTFLPESGEVHLDDSELWTNGSEYYNEGINLRQLLTHELGHALGLDHSSLPQAIMYAFYYYRNNFSLNPDDISGIESIYGKKIKVSTNSLEVISRKSTSALSDKPFRVSTTTKSLQENLLPTTKINPNGNSFWNNFLKWWNLL